MNSTSSGTAPHTPDLLVSRSVVRGSGDGAECSLGGDCGLSAPLLLRPAQACGAVGGLKAQKKVCEIGLQCWDRLGSFF